MIVEDLPYFLCTVVQAGSIDHEVSAGEHSELPDAIETWERVMVDHAWHGACRVWHVSPSGPRMLVACSTIGRDADAGLTAYGRSLFRGIDAPPVAYRLLPDPAAVIEGEHAFISRRLGPGMDQLFRCALTIADDGAWQCAIQAVTQNGRPSGPALVVNGTEIDPAVTALAIVAGAAPLPDRPLGAEPN